MGYTREVVGTVGSVHFGLSLMRLYLFCLAAVIGLDVGTATAQMFGRPRSLGRPLSRQAGPQALENVGTLTGNERFMRGNRGRESFVGADQRETQSFVGSSQARTSGTIISSTAGIDPPPDPSARINRPLATPPASAMYLPKIVLPREMAVAAESAATIPLDSQRPTVTIRVARALRLASDSPLAASVVDRTAILTGTVASEQERTLAETMVSFEPGISQVRNLIEVRPSR